MTYDEVKRIIKANKGIENVVNNMFIEAGLAYEIKPHENLEDYGVFYFIYVNKSNGDRMRCNCGRTPIEALENMTNMVERAWDENPTDTTTRNVAYKLRSIFKSISKNYTTT